MTLRDLLTVCAWVDTLTVQERRAFCQFVTRAITEGHVLGADLVLLRPDGQGGYEVLLPERAAP